MWREWVSERSGDDRFATAFEAASVRSYISVYRQEMGHCGGTRSRLRGDAWLARVGRWYTSKRKE